MLANERISAAKRIVIKVGSSSITGGSEANLDKIVNFAVELLKNNHEVILVSSGAIATAAPLIGLTAKAEDLPTSQALASIGQAKLMGRYERSLANHDKIPGQLLLTVENLTEPITSSNALLALERLIELGVLPIINENDSVATQEIRFGDNDQLAARVAILAKADLLVLLSDVDSLYTKHPEAPGAERIAIVSFGQDLSGIEVSAISTGYGTGGALTKLAAARTATASGIGVLLTETGNVSLIYKTDCSHTYFEPAG